MVINTTDIQLYEILRQKLGEKEAETLVTFVDTKIRENNEANLKIHTTKDDMAALRKDMVAVREDIAKMEARLTMRMFYFSIAQVAVMAGLLSFFFKMRG